MQDICLLQLHVVLAIDRAGLVGDDGPTHHGVFDVGFLRQMPGMRILAPASLAEQQKMLRWAIEEYDGPVAVRYPRGGQGSYTGSDWEPGKGLCCHRAGTDVALVTYGTLVNNVLEAAELLERSGIHACVLRLPELRELPAGEILARCSGPVVIVEEACTGSGIREALAWNIAALEPDRRVYGVDLGPDFVPHGATDRLYALRGLDSAAIAEYVKRVIPDED